MRYFMHLGLLLCLTAMTLAQAPRPGRQDPDAGNLGGDGAVASNSLWEDGEVRFYYDSNVNPLNYPRVQDALDHIQGLCGVKFIEVSGPGAFQRVLRFRNAGQNSSNVGHSGCGWILGCNHDVNISQWTKWRICHETMHALGFHHEMARPDRETYITVNYEFISSNNHSQFDIRSGAWTWGPYDFDSVMHYSRALLSNTPGQDSITCNEGYEQHQNTMGAMDGLSHWDGLNLQQAYGMPDMHTITGTTLPAKVHHGVGAFTFSVYGTGFYGGSNADRKIRGSTVEINGRPFPTSYVSSTELQVVVRDDDLTPGLKSLVVNNPSPGLGRTPPVTFTVGDRFKKVMITEVSWGAIDAVELTNFADTTVSLGSHRIEWADDRGVVQRHLIDFSMAPGEIVVFVESGSITPAEVPAGTRVMSLGHNLLTSSDAIAVALIGPNSVVKDEVRISGSDGVSEPMSRRGQFRFLVTRSSLTQPNFGCVERIWGLDSNSAGDWTEQPTTSFGLENRCSGPRMIEHTGSIVINEMDDSPDLIEFRNTGNGSVNVRDWFIRCSSGQGQQHVDVYPWPEDTTVEAGEYFVIGEGNPPAELPHGVKYVNIYTVSAGIPWTTAEYDCALYDHRGVLVDLVRTTGHDDTVVHNFPRTPAPWTAFTGYAGRNGLDSGAVGRKPSSLDTDTGADWGAKLIRTMGFTNTLSLLNAVGRGDRVDARIHDAHGNGALTFIVNADAQYAGFVMNILPSYMHSEGQGPVLGLGADAIPNWVALRNYEPWGALLDAQASYRFDIPVGSLPPTWVGDHIVVILDPNTGALQARTGILEEDH